jgi:hypothetical protein
MTQNAKKTFGLALTTAAIGLALTACGSSAGSAAPSPSASVANAPTGGASSPADSTSGGSTGGNGGTVPSASATPSGSPASNPVPSRAAGPAACIGPQLAVSAGQGDGAAGHIGARVIFKNTSTKPCTLYGFPGVAGLDAAGKQQVQAQRVTNGYLGTAKVTTVLVAPGASASALVAAVDVPSGNATSCPTYPKLLVTPPGTRDSHTVALSLPGCPTLDVYPVVPGVPAP